MDRQRAYRLDVPQLSGGLNAQTDAALIGDHELAAVCNLQWRDGALRTRKAMRAIGGGEPLSAIAAADKEGYVLKDTVDRMVSHPFEIDGELCTVVISAANYAKGSDIDHYAQWVQAVTLDGAVLRTYELDTRYVADMVVVPCDSQKNECAFLLYRGNSVYFPDDTTGKMVEKEAYAPLVMINGTSTGSGKAGYPYANGVMYEGMNVLTRRYRAQFTPTIDPSEGYADYFSLPTALQQNTEVTVEIVTSIQTTTVTLTVGEQVDQVDVDGSKYTMIASEKGHVAVTPPLPVSEISNTVTVTCTAADGSKENTYGATLATWFGGAQNRRGGTRLFLAGFAQNKAKVMWSDLNNPLYFPENNYIYVGDESQAITALEKQDDMLVIFKEREMYYTGYVQGEIDADAVAEGVNVDVTVEQAYFPITQLAPYIGCDCPHTIAVCRNRLVWMCSDARVYTLISANQYSERNVCEIGQKVRPVMCGYPKEQLVNASAADYDGEYWLMIGKEVFTFDYSSYGFVYVTSYYSGEKAAKSIVWHRYDFNGFPDGAVQRILSDGAYRALVISTQSLYTESGDAPAFTHVRTLYAPVEADTDEYVSQTLNADGGIQTTRRTVPIQASLTTKAYDFGDASMYKRIKALYVSACARNAQVRYVADGKGEKRSVRRYTSDSLNTHMALPCVKRCQTLSMVIDGEAPLAVRGLRVQYSPFGTVK